MLFVSEIFNGTLGWRTERALLKFGMSVVMKDVKKMFNILV